MRARTFTMEELQVLAEALIEYADHAASGDDEISRSLNRLMPVAERLLEELEREYIRRQNWRTSA